MIYLGFLFVFVASLASTGRWLRVAQREHYLLGSVLRFAWRWWWGSALNKVALCVALASLIATMFQPASSAGVIVVAIFGPVGLGLRGRTSTLAWTRRLRVLTFVVGLLAAIPIGLVAGLARLDIVYRLSVALLVAVPLLIDLALFITAPLERRIGNRFVSTATSRLRRVAPRVVAITGSYGKTTTKGYVAHLLSGHHSVVASPRSYNNRAGLARTVNEYLELGTELLVAEMGTYGTGEIQEMCSWMRPEIAVITAIGPVHLERFKDLSVTLSSKAEITKNANVVVLNVDDERLAGLVEGLVSEGKQVIRCSALDLRTDVCVRAEGDGLGIYRLGDRVGEGSIPIDLSGQALTNVACALGVVEALGDDLGGVIHRLGDLPQPPHRLVLTTGETGVEILDDTFNSNPAGARLALARLGEEGRAGGRRVLITPGMIELGSLQATENRKIAELASEICTEIVVVGRTNRSALLSGIGGRTVPITVRNREEAVGWVRKHLGAGDVVLYENDLPDHYA